MRWLRLLILALLIPLSACAINGQLPIELTKTLSPYTLDSGDVVRVSVYGDNELSGLYQVDDKGAISFPLVGPVNVRGVTTRTAAGRLTAALANGFMRSPNVAVEVSTYRPFFIQGEVGASGQYPYVYGMSVRAAISTAGGFSDTAERTKVNIFRPRGSQVIKGVVGMDFPIQPGDTIMVLQRWI